MSGTSEMASLLREAYGQIRALRAQLADHSAPIAIIGAGCRFPAGASDLASFARVLRAGTDAVGRVPPDRWGAIRAGRARRFEVFDTWLSAARRTRWRRAHHHRQERLRPDPTSKGRPYVLETDRLDPLGPALKPVERQTVEADGRELGQDFGIRIDSQREAADQIGLGRRKFFGAGPLSNKSLDYFTYHADRLIGLVFSRL